MSKHLFWLKIWLVFCFGLFCIYIMFRLFEYFRQGLWIKKIKKSHLLIKRSGKFNKKYGEKVSYSEFQEFINKVDFGPLPERPAWFELFECEKIVFFEIPWGEVYCKCNDDYEYNELIKIVDNKFQESQET